MEMIPSVQQETARKFARSPRRKERECKTNLGDRMPFAEGERRNVSRAVRVELSMTPMVKSAENRGLFNPQLLPLTHFLWMRYGGRCGPLSGELQELRPQGGAQ